tara:strand:+ start:51 stop:782 length:732 start_codon:yes stop_codon:yes gene_type:complete
MKRLFLLVLTTGLLSPVRTKAFEINCDSIVWRDKEECAEVEKKPSKIDSDVNIKGLDPKNLLFNTFIPSTSPPNTRLIYDRGVEGDMCFISCNFYNGVTSKWTDFFVDLQPFENFCMALTGCSGQYPSPADTVNLKVSEMNFKLSISDRKQNRYYLPLKARKAISNSEEEISIEIPGAKMPIYVIGKENRQNLSQLVNTDRELTKYLSKESKKVRLSELKELLDEKLIDNSEYKKAREKILAE